MSIGDGIARVYGLKNIQAEEMVEFTSGLKVYYDSTLFHYITAGNGLQTIEISIIFIPIKLHLTIYSWYYRQHLDNI